jgi:hypothetical protein
MITTLKTIEPHRRFFYDGANMLKPGKNLFSDFGTSKPTLTELEKEEEIIGRGKATFIEVGEALARVRDKKLYQEKGYATFQEYFETRLGLKKSQVYRLMDAGEEALKLAEPERPKTEKSMRKVLSDRRTSPRGEVHTKRKSVIKEVDWEPVITPEDKAAELFDDVEKRIRKNRKNLTFLQALDKWLEDRGE